MAMRQQLHSMVFLAACSMMACGFGSTSQSADLASAGDHPNVPANNCEIYVSRVVAAPSSHGLASIYAVVRVPWLGNGEMIERVGFYGRTEFQDQGNSAECHSGPSFGNGGFSIVDPSRYGRDLALGEYQFDFLIDSGSVVSMCPGYTYSWIGTFFLQTNYRTYWLNPDMDPAKLFYFDDNGYTHIYRRAGMYSPVSTLQEGMSYYNPKACTR